MYLRCFFLWNKQYLDPIAPSYLIAEPEYLGGDDSDAAVDGTIAASVVVDIGNVGAAATTVSRATANSPTILARESSKKLSYRPDEVDNTDRLVENHWPA